MKLTVAPCPTVEVAQMRPLCASTRPRSQVGGNAAGQMQPLVLRLHRHRRAADTGAAAYPAGASVAVLKTTLNCLQ